MRAKIRMFTQITKTIPLKIPFIKHLLFVMAACVVSVMAHAGRNRTFLLF